MVVMKKKRIMGGKHGVLIVSHCRVVSILNAFYYNTPDEPAPLVNYIRMVVSSFPI